ncbi:MAG: 4Fe-4S single cluster domain-containing protein [Acidobacteriota bacterium]
MTKINLAHLATCRDAMGPGLRVMVWVQGCPHRCAGCITPGMLAFRERELIEPERLVARILRMSPEIEGVTLVGGEPFSQAAALSAVADILRHEHDKGVICYSGYTLAELREGQDSGWSRLLDRVDLLIDGRYVREEATDRLWRGSSNQTLHFLTERYRPLEKLLQFARGSVLDFQVDREGHLVALGIPPPGAWTELLTRLRARGLHVSPSAPPPAN